MRAALNEMDGTKYNEKPPDVKSAVAAYNKRGLATIRIARGEKAPQAQGWQRQRHAPDDFHDKSNIGVIMGDASGALIDVDIDDDEGLPIAAAFLPPTGSIYGRGQRPASHYEYICPGLSYAKYQLGNNTLIELRATSSQQSIYPPSVHPSGDIYMWDRDGDPAKVSAADLTAGAGKLAAAIALRKLARRNSGLGIALSVIGMLLRAGWTDEDVAQFVERIVVKREKVRRRLKLVAATRRRLENDRPCAGFGKLCETIGDDAARLIAGWLGVATPPKELTELNERHFVILNDGGKCSIYEWLADPILRRRYLSAQSFAEFKKRYGNRFVRAGVDAKGQPKFKPLGTWWTEHGERHQYARLVMAPNQNVPGAYNMWTGFACEARQGDWSLLREHLRNNVCAGVLEHYEYLLGWMARAVQRPELPGEVALVMRGPRGAGKGIVVRELGALFGQHFIHISSSKHLVGNFNAHLRDCVVLFADEAFWAGDKAGESTLKALITEPSIAIEAKGRDIVMVPNMLHLAMATNHDWAIPAGFDERRFFVLDVGDDRVGDLNYFGKLAEQMNTGGREGMLHDLLHRDLSAFEVRRVPNTPALMDQKRRSMSLFQSWWFERLWTGRLPEHDAEAWLRGPVQVRKDLLVANFREEMKPRVSQRSSETSMTADLRRVMPEGWPKDAAAVQAEETYWEGQEQKTRLRQHATYEIPNLWDLRTYFCSVTNAQWEWPAEKSESPGGSIGSEGSIGSIEEDDHDGIPF